MSNIKLLICYHKPATLFKDEIMTPIHVGRANAKKRMASDNENLQWLMENMIGDDTGENISDQNGTYNELTSLYWAWKNYDELGNPDYIGLMHYRRHFVWRENEHIVYNIENFNEEKYLQEINYSHENVHKMIDGCDFVAHIGKVINVYKHYVENHRKEDLDLAVEILLEKHPEYKQVTEKYFAGDYSNFCNMFIFSREIFFQYCEWIFDILQEFGKRTDVSEKRFFISERLTGIFIANLMENKNLKYKTVPISFIEDPVNIPIALPVNTENIYQTAHSLTSILQAAKGYNTFHFCLLYRRGQLEEKAKNKFEIFEEQYPFCRIEFVEMDIDEEYYPLMLSEKLSKINKCIYAAGNFVVLQDLGEFFRICSTDDYYAVGTPSGKYDAFIEQKKLSPDILTLNCARLRKHNLWENAKVQVAQGKTGSEILNQLCKGQIGYIPWYFVTRESDYPYKDKILGDSKSRGQVQEEATWRAWLLYDEIVPWINSQGVYSIFWWDNAVHVPSMFGFVKTDSEKIEALYAEQQMEINTYVPTPPAVNEEWKSYSSLGKLRFFYQYNGLRKTITYLCKKAIKVFIRKEKISHA